MSNRLYNSIKIYIILIIIIILIRPHFLYDRKNNKFKSFGTKRNETIFSLPIISILLAISIYIFLFGK